MQKFEEWMMSFATKFAQSKVLNTIQSAFMMMLPVTMVGSFASLLKGVSVGGYQAWLQSTPLYNALGAVYQWTTGLIAVYIVFLVAYNFKNVYQLKSSAVSLGIVALMGFMIVTPFEPAADAYSSANLPTNWLGSSGMFVAILMGFLTGLVFMFCEKKNIRITMPDSVPPMVAGQFTVLFPAIFMAVICMIINIVFSFTAAGSVQQLIYSLLSAPLYAVSGSIFGNYILTVIIYMLWFFGIHGGMTVAPIMMMLFMQVGMENLAAYQAGTELPHMWIGTGLSYGSGSLPMLIAMFLFAKSEANRSITKLAIIPSFMGVDEPAYFGTPMILNPVFFLPWVVITPAISLFGTYALLKLGLLPYATGASAGTFVPFFVTDIVSYGIRGVLWGLVIMALCVLVYIPFVKVYDRQKVAEEQAAMENN